MSDETQAEVTEVVERTEEEQAQFDIIHQHALIINFVRDNYRRRWIEALFEADPASLRLMKDGVPCVIDDADEVVNNSLRLRILVATSDDYYIVITPDSDTIAIQKKKPAMRSSDDAAAVAGLLEEDDELRNLPASERARAITQLLVAEEHMAASDPVVSEEVTEE